MSFSLIITIFVMLAGIITLTNTSIISRLFLIIDKNEKRPTWSYRSATIIRNRFAAYPETILRFGDQKINSLTVSKMVIWNAGSYPIRKSDIVPTNRLRVTVKEKIDILDVKIISSTDERSNAICTLVKDNNVVFLDFDILSRAQGVQIQVIHTGEEASFQVEGKLINSKNLEYRTLEEIYEMKTDIVKNEVLRGRIKTVLILLSMPLLLIIPMTMIGVDITFTNSNLRTLSDISQLAISSLFTVFLFSPIPLALVLLRSVYEWAIAEWKIISQALPHDIDPFLVDILE